jgi:hypothetical protein
MRLSCKIDYFMNPETTTGSKAYRLITDDSLDSQAQSAGWRRTAILGEATPK